MADAIARTSTATVSESDQLLERRVALRLRHTQALTSLMEERADLKGVVPLADYFDDAVRWSA